MFWDQSEYGVRCEWGAQGLAALRETTDVFVIVDVLSFSTCVDIAVGNGALVLPYQWRDATAEAYALAQSAVLAAPRRSAGAFTLAPLSLLDIPAGTRLVLPSPNGSTLSSLTGALPTFAGCLRNARAVARAAQAVGGRVSVIAAGERWPDGSLRPAVEDLLGAGAIVAELAGARSPEASVAEQAFRAARPELLATLERCSSGRELIEQGFGADVALAAAHNTSEAAPRLRDAAYSQ